VSDDTMLWLGNPIAYLAIWMVMMVGMMLPSLAPVLRRYRRPVALAAAYFLVWGAFGTVAYVVGTMLVRVTRHSPTLGRALPIVLGVLLAASGLVQFTGWKRRQLACCRDCAPSAAHSAWSDGLRLGLHCCQCCIALMALLFAAGMMRLGAIVLVGSLIAAERLLPRPLPIVRVIGVGVTAFGTFSTWRALS
jgi:predicted metal-binding membrane protein